MPTLATLVFVPFFTVALDKGQRPLNVIQITGSLYNVRFGLIMAIPAAILIGYLASLFSRQSMFGLALATVLVVLAGSFTYDAFQKVDSNIITLQEPLVYATQKGGEVQRYAAAGKYLQDHYKGGLVLEQSYGNEEVLFDAKVPTSNNIYEGSYKLWQPALKDPIRSHIVWIVMSNSQADQVFTSLHNSPALKPYRLVYNHLNYKIYERK
jgi:hypothetical protein